MLRTSLSTSAGALLTLVIGACASPDNNGVQGTGSGNNLGGFFGVGGQGWGAGGLNAGTGGVYPAYGGSYDTGGGGAAGTFGAGGIIGGGGSFGTGGVGVAGFANSGGDVGVAGSSGTAGSFGTGGDIGVGGSFNTGGDVGVGGSFNTGGDIGVGGSNTGGDIGAGGTAGTGGTIGAGGVGTGGSVGGTSGMGGTGGANQSTGGAAGSGGGTATCCPTGDCLCHGPVPSSLTSGNGPFTTANFTTSVGTIHYPTDAEPPFAGVSICPGFLNTGPEMAPWGPFYASYGIVTVVTNTVASDLPDVRATKLLAAITQLKTENTTSSSPLFGKMAGRYGTSGYSMGGGGTTLASAQDSTLLTSVGLAPWGGNGTGVQVPTLLFCGDADTVAPCNMAQGVYTGMPSATDKMLIVVPGATHFNWFSPTDAGGGTSGKYALAFQKVFLEGDERWRPLLVTKPSAGTQTTNIQ